MNKKRSLIDNYEAILEQQGYSFVYLRDGLYVFRELPVKVEDFSEEDWKYFYTTAFHRTPLPLDWQFS